MTPTPAPLTEHRTPVLGCPACEQKRRHTAEDWLLHPHAGQGASREHGAPKAKPEGSAA